MTLSIPLLLVTVLGCGSPEPVDPSKTPDGRLCQRAHSSTIDTLTDVFTQSGKPMPEFVSKDAYVEKCVTMGFSEGQLKCLDPKLAMADPAGCTTTLEPVKAKQEELMKWFAEQSGLNKKPEGKTGKGKTKAGAPE